MVADDLSFKKKYRTSKKKVILIIFLNTVKILIRFT